jgi:predicted nucleic acid-binding protein
MSDWGVDSSVAVKWALTEADSPQALRVLTDVPGAGGRLWLLDVALAEVTNAIWKHYHRKLLSLDQARQFLADFLRTPVQVVSSQPLLPAAFEIAAKYGMAVYDALFVALVVDRGAAGVTADEPLHRAVHADYPQICLLRNWPPPKP